jgi:formylglycine-generating enzyme required for sulfatase activity
VRHTHIRLPPAGRFVHGWFQFGLTFEAYPLAVSPENLCGATREGKALEITLPPGSYLLVLEKPGFAAARLPVVVPRSREIGPVRLVPSSDVPPSFTYVPEGVAAAGGDPKATDSLDRGEHLVAGFFIGRFEVTQGEWLEFANGPEVLARTDRETGMARASLEILVRSPGRLEHYRIVPRRSEKPLVLLWSFDPDAGAWNYSRRDLPAFDISHHAALEYTAWRTARERREGKPWTYGLPTDLEWERAARGEDRRYHVWGDYLVWSFSASRPGNFKRSLPEVGVSPFDESVFGVRDLAGSVLEHTSDHTLAGEEFRSWRGGHYQSPDDYLFRCARRNGLPAGQNYRHFGLRLAADLLPAGD